MVQESPYARANRVRIVMKKCRRMMTEVNKEENKKEKRRGNQWQYRKFLRLARRNEPGTS